LARNGSGIYSLSDTIAPSDPQSSTVLMGILNDIKDGLTASVAADGQTTITGPLKAADGSITAPGYAFNSDGNTGFYRSASGVIRATCDGTNSFTIAATGITSPVITASTSLTVGAVTNAHVPAGVIVMWSGSIASIPTGWLLCDGTNSTPDLRDRFVIGARQDDSGTARTNVTGSLTQTGGSKDAIVVSHTHTATVTDPGHNHSTTITGTNAGTTFAEGSRQSGTGSRTSSSETTGITVSNSTTGSSGTDANLPPYYALAFIMKA
jgi:microcystin-dependent protein